MKVRMKTNGGATLFLTARELRAIYASLADVLQRDSLPLSTIRIVEYIQQNLRRAVMQQEHDGRVRYNG